MASREREQAEQPRPTKQVWAVFQFIDPMDMLATRLSRLTQNDGYTVQGVIALGRDVFIIAWREE